MIFQHLSVMVPFGLVCENFRIFGGGMMDHHWIIQTGEMGNLISVVVSMFLAFLLIIIKVMVNGTMLVVTKFGATISILFASNLQHIVKFSSYETNDNDHLFIVLYALTNLLLIILIIADNLEYRMTSTTVKWILWRRL